VQRHEIACPDCGSVTAWMFKDGKLQPYAAMLDDELKEIRLATSGADGKLENARSALAAAQAALARHDGASKQAIGEADKRTEQAASIHRQIQAALKIAEILGPRGLRGEMRGEVFALVNSALAELSAVMGIDPVEVVQAEAPGGRGETITATMGGRPYHALSRSEQWRVDVLLQLEIARRDGSAMVVIDGADILDGPARFGLVKGLEHAGLRAVVFMTAAAPSKVADPAKWPYGPLYWTGDNTVTALADAIAAKTSKAA
jgi:hypothetical protein